MVSNRKRQEAKERRAKERAKAAAEHAARSQARKKGWRSIPTWGWAAIAVAVWASLEGGRRALGGGALAGAREADVYNLKNANVPRALLEQNDGADANAEAADAADAAPFRRVFHTDPDVHVWDDFLSDAECAEIVELADARPESKDPQGLDGGWAYLDNARANGYMYVSPTPTRPILVEIEKRIAAWTGYAVHGEETGMKIKRQGNTGQRSSSGVVHMDINSRPWRRATVIFYCNDMDETQGGATVFPCLTPDPEPGSALADPDTTDAARNRTAYLARVAAERHRHCEEGTESVRKNARADRGAGGERGYRYAYSQHGDASSPLFQAADGMCRALQEGGAGATSRGRQAGGMADGTPGIYVQPRKGRAVMFRKTSHHHTWHAGCEVRTGVKWAAQKFKELPVPLRAGERSDGTAWKTDTVFSVEDP